jgi:hypothetical protein
MSDDTWRPCSTCKKPLLYDSVYWVCNVSTCNRARTGLVFCSVDCWDAHVPTMRHKESWAEERRSPKRDEAAAGPKQKRRVEIRSRFEAAPSGAKTRLDPRPADEILVVASKVKAYVRARSGLRTSDGVMEALSEKVREICDDAIRVAQKNERKTVLDRDVP